MDKLNNLSPAHCILLALHHTLESNIDALRTLIALRPDAFGPEHTLRLLLTYLPETVESEQYVSLVQEIAIGVNVQPSQNKLRDIELAPIQDISSAQAKRRVKKLHLLPLALSSEPVAVPAQDILTHYLIHRAHRVDAETGLLSLVPGLVAPFVDGNQVLRTWFVADLLPLLRWGYEYYPGSSGVPGLEAFERLEGERGVGALLAAGQREGKREIARDLRGLVGPWMVAKGERRRRKGKRRFSVDGRAEELQDERTREKHGWEHVFTWLVKLAIQDFPLAAATVEEWDGPGDVDLGGYVKLHDYLSEEEQRTLEMRYAQAVLAIPYAVEADTPETIHNAHGLLVRLARLLDFDPPPDLATSIELLPKIDSKTLSIEHTSGHTMTPTVLLSHDHPLTKPRLETFALLQMFVYSAYMLAELGHSVSVAHVAQIRFGESAEEQIKVVRRILLALVSGKRQDEGQWALVRSRVLWLWDWGLEDTTVGERSAAGVFGRVKRTELEKEVLRAFVASGTYPLVVKAYIDNTNRSLPPEAVEAVIVDIALSHYDNASNGNRTRGGMRKASEVIATFRPHHPNSPSFARLDALLKATHALSFYSLTLQHGVPFAPVNIRAAADPVGLISKVLAQNPRSYTKVDDLVFIARNLVAAGLPAADEEDEDGQKGDDDKEMKRKQKKAEKRVMAMAVEASLAEEDFETAYSYVMNKLDVTPEPSSHTSFNSDKADEYSYRAAFLAGRHPRPPLSSSTSSTANLLRPLNQRLELLSRALLLAPADMLTEILQVWRKCEEEMLALEAAEEKEALGWDDRGEGKTAGMPGSFAFGEEVSGGRWHGVQTGNKRPEIRGRWWDGGANTLTSPTAAKHRRSSDDETPLSLFDLARGVTSGLGLGRSVGSLRDVARGRGDIGGYMEGMGKGDRGDTGERVRRRDVVASAAMEGLAKGVGWVIGQSPFSPFAFDFASIF
ncbi:secretory pathway Sec39 [Patellaria atrata CBS 101060]|uniref:Secretory pathway Sec39 n=1 Tax=Patellaria atrata CBS 101060 TaxID=1346257 RepID=A0A9P4VMJ6_9PEZI|nr:secretory pathway Sec39 [Patellaria atrata CBS 101060]